MSRDGFRMLTMTALEIDTDVIGEFCRRNHIQRLSLFGSTLRGDEKPDSDVDLLVQFDPAHVPGYFRLVAMEEELSAIFGRKADLRTAQELNRHFRDEVVGSARLLYAAE
jgi:predicted nucleotidyltransferase